MQRLQFKKLQRLCQVQYDLLSQKLLEHKQFVQVYNKKLRDVYTIILKLKQLSLLQLQQRQQYQISTNYSQKYIMLTNLQSKLQQLTSTVPTYIKVQRNINQFLNQKFGESCSLNEVQEIYVNNDPLLLQVSEYFTNNFDKFLHLLNAFRIILLKQELIEEENEEEEEENELAFVHYLFSSEDFADQFNQMKKVTQVIKFFNMNFENTYEEKPNSEIYELLFLSKVLGAQMFMDGNKLVIFMAGWSL
ncbi:Hypothetical_protein [Hexamita inflata]|uniref:Hypothetical_protein n=1 Tax=Hexamita inflata TaxID=28002 RepID=A0ABP1GFS6_9EUKA